MQWIATQGFANKVNQIAESTDASAADILANKIAFTSAGYVTGTMATKTSLDIGANGATVTIPSGYYSQQINKTVATTNLSDVTLSFAPATGLITAQLNQNTSGFIQSGTKSSSIQLTLISSVNVNNSTVTIPSGYYSSQLTQIIPSASHVKPTIAFESSTGKITATHIQAAGYVNADTSSDQLSLTTLAASTYTPTTTPQTIASNKWLTGTQTIAGDANLVAGNIKAGTTIFGVIGNFSGTGGGGITITDATAAAEDILSGKTAYINSGKITGIMPTKTSANATINGSIVTVPSGYYSQEFTKTISSVTHSNPTITFDSSAGTITVQHTQGTGYVTGGTTNSTKTLTTLAASTYTPTTTAQTIAFNQWITGTQTILGDSKLTADNIKYNTTIFNVAGTFTYESSKSASEADILSGKIAFVNGSKLTGTLPTITHTNPTIEFDYINNQIKAIHTQGTAGYLDSGTTTSTITVAFQSATTITPGTTDQTIAANTYLSEAVTISGDSNLIPGNIKSGTTIFSVTGTYSPEGGGSNNEINNFNYIIYSIPSQLTGNAIPTVKNNTSVTKVQFNNFTAIPVSGFAGCTNLIEVTMEQAVTINQSAFSNCTKLTTVNVPNVTNILTDAFKNCTNLQSLYLMSPTVVTLSNSKAFFGADNCIFYVPTSLLTSYKSASNWSYYADRIVGV